MEHIMIDLETFGTAQTSIFFSIGACFFDPENGKIGDTFERNLNIQEQIDLGRTFSANTIKWWFSQSDEARAKVKNKESGFKKTLEDFAFFVKTGHENTKVWGNGSTFDISILENAYGEEKQPWAFWNVRDVRTVVDLAYPKIKRDSFVFDGIKHDALSDAIHQAKYVSAMWAELKK